VSTSHPSQHELLTAQASQIRESYPELYAFLVERQREMRHALGRIPHPDDLEAVAPAGVVDDAIGRLRHVSSSIDDLLAGSTSGSR